MESSTFQTQTYRLTNGQTNNQRPAKRLKSTGDEQYTLRQLKYTDKSVTNDEIHDEIEMCPVMKALVDTEVFQRLRNINQLANAQYVYACANHTRYQHSMGVAFLAQRMCERIREEQPELGATDKDVLCVKLAGLLHDIGHGPFSHLYESFRHDYLPQYLDANPDLKEEYADCEHLKPIPKWSHEQSSLIFIDAALEELGLEIDLNNLDGPLKQIGNGIDANSMRVFKPHNVENGVLTSRDFLFIKECILGEPLEGNKYFVGRQEQKLEWLYDIVSNRHTGLDVDKIDYFARDSSRTIGRKGIHSKMITDARVAKGICSRPEKCFMCKHKREPGLHYMICYPEKHIDETMEFFKHRFHMHSVVYQHKTNSVIENMLCDILCLADPFLRLTSHSNEEFPMSRAYLKSDFLIRLDDGILNLIDHSQDERLSEARELYRRFKKRDLYKCAVSQSLDIDRVVLDIDELEGDELEIAKNSERDVKVWKMTESEIHQGILQEFWFWNEQDRGKSTIKLEAKDFTVKKYCMHRGAGSKNPLLRMRFFDKRSEERLFGSVDDLPVAKQIEESIHSDIITKSFQKVGIRVMVRQDSKRELVSQHFSQWFNVRMKHKQEPDQCGLEVCDVDDMVHEGNENQHEWDQDHNNNGNQNAPVMLSQDFDDSAEDTDDDNGRRLLHYDDMSPVPVQRNRSHFHL